MYQSIMTKAKHFGAKDWVVETIVNHKIMIF